MRISYSLIIDGALALLLLLGVLIYRKKGFLAGVLQLAGSIGAAVGAYIVAGKASRGLFDSFLKTGLMNRITEMVSTTAGAVKASEIVEGLLKFLPDNLAQSLLEKTDALIAAGQPAGTEMAAEVVETVIAPVVVPLISILVFFLVFILARLVLSLLVAALKNVNKAPVVGGINRLLGALVGLLAGGVYVYIASCALGAVALVTNNTLPAVNTAVLQESFLCALFWAYNPFVA